MKLYLKYRCTHGNLWQWRYTISYMYNQDRSWYVDNAWVNIQDLIIPDEKYKEEAKGKMFAIVEFDETKISYSDLAFDLDHCYVQYWVKVLSQVEALDFIRNLTTLVETETNTFLVSEASEILWISTPAIYLTID